MEWGRLLALLPLAYIIWWFYTLFAIIIPWLSTAIGETLSMTWLQIVGVILFFMIGIPVLIIVVFVFFMILCVD